MPNERTNAQGVSVEWYQVLGLVLRQHLGDDIQDLSECSGVAKTRIASMRRGRDIDSCKLAKVMRVKGLDYDTLWASYITAMDSLFEMGIQTVCDGYVITPKKLTMASKVSRTIECKNGLLITLFRKTVEPSKEAG